MNESIKFIANLQNHAVHTEWLQRKEVPLFAFEVSKFESGK